MQEVKHRNRIRHSASVRLRVKKLRGFGRTHREIAKEVGVSLGSAALWTKGIKITPTQKRAIEQRRKRPVMTPELLKKLRRNVEINLAPHREKYTKKELLNKIISFHKTHGRIPLKKEFNMHREYKRRFGSWNNAIKESGFNGNPVIFAYKFKARDGHGCDSFTEKIIDNLLDDNKISHERSFRYGNTKMTGDFFIKPNIVIEFFGLAGVQETYDTIISKKRALVKKLKLQLIEIYPNDIYPVPEIKLASLLKEKLHK